MPLLWAGRKGPASYTRYFALGMHLSPALQSPFSFHLGCGYDGRKKKKINYAGSGLANSLHFEQSRCILVRRTPINYISLGCSMPVLSIGDGR